MGTTTAGLISNSDYSLFSTVMSKITSSAAAIAQVLGYTPADQAVVTTLSSTVGSVSSAANAAQATANSVSSTVNSLSSTVAGKITSSAAAVAQVLGYVPAASGSMVSQWATSGSTINYSGHVGIGTTNPQYKLAVSGTSHLKGRVMIGNTPFMDSNFDFGPMIGNGTFYSPLVVQETITDFSNPTTLGNMNVTLLNAPSDSSVLSAGRFNLIQNTASSTANHSMIIGDYSKGLVFYEYYDANNNGQMCNPGDTCANRMTIAQGGNVGINVGAPSTTLQVGGIISPAADNNYSLGTGALRYTAVYAVNGAIQTSDERQKKNITNSDLGLDFINKLRPVSYNWKTGEDKSVHYGLIAQETEKIVNESRGVASNEPTPIVDYDKESDRYGIRYTELLSPVIKAIQEIYFKLVGHDEKITELERKVASLEAENKAKEEKNKELEQRLQNIEKALQNNK